MRNLVCAGAAAAVLCLVSSAARAQDVPTPTPSEPATVVARSTIHLGSPPEIARFDTTGNYIAWQDDQLTLSTGAIGPDQPIMTYPFRYIHLLRLAAPIGPLIGAGIPAGSVGFDAGEFRAVGWPEHVMCFFDAKKPEASRYGKPSCLRYIGHWGFKWALAPTQNNLVNLTTYGDGVIGEPQLETEGVTIDHDFQILLFVDGWSRKNVRLVWKSDGRMATYGAILLKLDNDGVGRIATNDGMIILTHDAGDTTRTIVSFTPRL